MAGKIRKVGLKREYFIRYQELDSSSYMPGWFDLVEKLGTVNRKEAIRKFKEMKRHDGIVYTMGKNFRNVELCETKVIAK